MKSKVVFTVLIYATTTVVYIYPNKKRRTPRTQAIADGSLSVTVLTVRRQHGHDTSTGLDR